MSSDVAAKLAELRAATVKKPFPLLSLLTLYSKSPHSLYIDHFEGFKLLVDWLSPIEIPSVQEFKIPLPFHTYTVQEVAKILNCSQCVVYKTFREIYRD